MKRITKGMKDLPHRIKVTFWISLDDLYGTQKCFGGGLKGKALTYHFIRLWKTVCLGRVRGRDSAYQKVLLAVVILVFCSIIECGSNMVYTCTEVVLGFSDLLTWFLLGQFIFQHIKAVKWKPCRNHLFLHSCHK